jgi:hypothetical protein
VISGDTLVFLGTWTGFDPMTLAFSWVKLPRCDGEEPNSLMADGCITDDNDRSLLAVNQRLTRTAIMLQIKPIR